MPRIPPSLASQVPTPESAAPEVAVAEVTQAPAPPAVLPHSKGGALAAYGAGKGFTPLVASSTGPRANLLNRFSPISKYAADVRQSIPDVKEGDWYVVTTQGQYRKALAAWLVDRKQWWTNLEWTTDQAIAQNLSISVQLLEWKQNQLIGHAQQDSYPGNGLWPTVRWQPGIRVTDHQFIGNVEGTQLGVFIYDRQTGQKIDTTNHQIVLFPLPIGN